MYQQPPQTKKPKPIQTNSLLESLRDVTGGVKNTVTRDVVGKVGVDVFSALTGAVPKPTESPYVESFFGRERRPMSPFRKPDVHRPPIVKLEEINLKQQIEAVRAELKALTASMKNFNTEVQKAVSEIPAQPGIYHLNFIERLRGIVRILRQQIEDSRTWLSLTVKRKKQKMYWGLYKKHGTKFGLSSERTIATQVG